MDDDCNTARALGVVFETIREMNRVLDAGETSDLAATATGSCRYWFRPGNDE